MGVRGMAIKGEENCVSQEEQDVQELRRHRRKPVLWAAHFDTDGGPFGCVIVNISKGGAMLQFAEPFLPQHSGKLVIERYGELQAEIVWRRRDKKRIGIRFTGAAEEIAQVLPETMPL
jgi:hypothetical protein